MKLGHADDADGQLAWEGADVLCDENAGIQQPTLDHLLLPGILKGTVKTLPVC